MNEERRMILKMLSEGTITVQEAENLLAAIPDVTEESNVVVRNSGGGLSPKRIVVQVKENGRMKVNVRVPFSLVRAGLKMGKSFGVYGIQYDDDNPGNRKAMEMLQDLDVDELLASIDDGEITLPYILVDVDNEDDGVEQSVRVVIE